MARRNKLLELERTKGDLSKLIPETVNKHGSQLEAARELGVSQATISTWLRDNGFQSVVKWVRSEGEKAS